MEEFYKTELIATGNCLDACIKVLRLFDPKTKIVLEWPNNIFEDNHITLSDFITAIEIELKDIKKITDNKIGKKMNPK